MNASSSLGFRKGFVGLLCGIGMLGSVGIAHAAGWVAQTSPVTNMMFGMDCASSVCVQVGAGGTVIRSSDYQTWTEGTSGVTTNLINVDMYSATTGIAVGMSGTILKTTDGGVTWSSITGVTTEDIYGVSMVSSTVAYIAAQDTHIFKTTDGGTTWTEIGSTLPGIDAYTIDAYSSSIVYVAGKSGVAYKTTDGGTTWTLLTTGTTEHIYAIDAVSSTTVFLGGANALIAKTTDGATFSLQTLPDFGASEAVTDLSCTSGSLCLLSGSEGIVEITGDGGTTWTKEAMPSTAVLGGVANVAVGRRFVGGFDGAIFALDNYGPNEIEDFALATGGTSTTDTTPEFTWSDATDDESSVVSYEIDVDNAESWTDIGDVNTYTASTLSVGAHTMSIRAIDEAGNEGSETDLSFTITAESSDTTEPTVGTVTPTSATQDEAVTFTVVATDDEAIYNCYLVVDGDDQGVMTEGSSSKYTKSYTPALSGEIEVSVWCGDTSENVGIGDTVTVTVAEAEETDEDTTDPTVGAITPDEATEGTAVTLRASVADSGGMGTCVLYVDSTYVGSMTISGGYASRSYTFADDGASVANAYCTDAAGNTTRGATTTIDVAAASDEETDEEAAAVDEADEGSLIKLACDSDADVEDPCHAVYYFDGKRHAFPNEKVFLTWYDDFDDIVIVTDEYMSSITLGYNVTYHPGSRMVKFVTVNTVYGVGADGELRAIASEEVAESIWGSEWNTLIDDISDAFYGNYRFGDDIDSTSDFDPDEVEDSVTDIEEILDAV